MKQNIKIAIVIFIGLLVLTPVFVSADWEGFVRCGHTPTTQCGIGDLFVTIRSIINFLLSWAWLVCIIFIVWSGWSMITAAGNEEAITKAKGILSNAVIGFFLIMVAFVLLNWVVSILTGDSIPKAGSIDEVFKLIP